MDVIKVYDAFSFQDEVSRVVTIVFEVSAVVPSEEENGIDVAVPNFDDNKEEEV